MVREFKIPDGVPVGQIGEPLAVAHAADTARPYVLMQRRWTLGWEREALDWNWSLFFPDVPTPQRETYDYPQPLSDQFWQEYAEPVPEFISAVDAFREAVEGLLTPSTSQAPALPESDPRSPMYRIHALLAPLSPSVVPGLRGRKFFWTTPSLLASFALMAANDETQGWLRRCQACQMVFFPLEPNQVYCSDEHRQRQNKRVQRLHDRAEEMHAAGTPIAEIAAKLNASEADVGEWVERRRKMTQAAAMHSAGRAVDEIAQDLGASAAEVSEWIRRRAGRSSSTRRSEA